MVFSFDDYDNINPDIALIGSIFHPGFKHLRAQYSVLAEDLLEEFCEILQDSPVPLLTCKILISKFLEVADREDVLRVYDKLEPEYKDIYQKYFLEWQFKNNQQSLLEVYEADKKFRKINNKRSRRQPEIKELDLESSKKSKKKKESEFSAKVVPIISFLGNLNLDDFS